MIALPPAMALAETLDLSSEVATRLAWSPDGQFLAVATYLATLRYSTLRIWRVGSPDVFFEKGWIESPIVSLTWSPDCLNIAVGTIGHEIIVWGVESRRQQGSFKAHSAPVCGLAWSSDGEVLASCAEDGSIALWNVIDWKDLRRTAIHEKVIELRWIADSRHLLCADSSGRVRILTAERLALVHSFESDTLARCATYAPATKTLYIGDARGGITVLDLRQDTRDRFEGGPLAICSLSLSQSEALLAARDELGGLRIWNCSNGRAVAGVPLHTAGDWQANALFNPVEDVLALPIHDDARVGICKYDEASLVLLSPEITTSRYLNAKIAVVGPSGVGKSGLVLRLLEDQFRSTESTHCACVLPLPIAHSELRPPPETTLECVIWDFAGQEHYRLIHQLFMADADTVLVLFDGSSPDCLAGLASWAKLLDRCAPRARRIFVAARCDVSPLRLTRELVAQTVSRFDGYAWVETSARTGAGVEELRRTILKTIDWTRMPVIEVPRLFHVARELVGDARSGGVRLIKFEDFAAQARRVSGFGNLSASELDKVLDQLAVAGLALRVEPITGVRFILLQPEIIGDYASAVLRAARDNPQGIGSVPARAVATALVALDCVRDRLEPWSEKIVLEAVGNLLLEREFCFLDLGLLVFPSEIQTVQPTESIMSQPPLVTYRVEGSVDELFSCLVVRFNQITRFTREKLWKHAAEYSLADTSCGFTVRANDDGTVEISVCSTVGDNRAGLLIFCGFVREILKAKARELREFIHAYCPECREEVTSHAAIRAHLERGSSYLHCQFCGGKVPLWQTLEQRFGGGGTEAQRSQLTLDDLGRPSLASPRLVGQGYVVAGGVLAKPAAKRSDLPGHARQTVFICYSHTDQAWLDKLAVHLKPVLRSIADVEQWCDRDIKPGQLWRNEVNSALERARIAVLLVSPEMLASDFIIEEEMPRIFERARHGGLTVIWIAVRPSSVHATWINDYQCSNDPESPLANLSPGLQDHCLVQISTKIGDAVKKARASL